MKTRSATTAIQKVVTGADFATQIYASFAAFAFVTSGIVYLYLGRWPVANQDYWRIYDFCFKHTWLQSALHKHNGHSLFFPSFFWLTDLQFFHGRQQPLFFAGLALMFVAIGLLLLFVWRDKTVSRTAKIVATLVVIVANFWMARSSITASGGFNCVESLTLLSVVLAFLLLPRLRAANRVRKTIAMVVVISAGFVASFSFGAGLAIWPALLISAWCLRLSRRTLSVLLGAGVAAGLIFLFLPPDSPFYFELLRRNSRIQSVWSLVFTLRHASAGSVLGQFSLAPALSRFFTLVGSPMFYAASGWHTKPIPMDAAESSKLALVWGATGFVLALAVVARAALRRDLAESSLERVGIALTIFNLAGIFLIVLGRAGYFGALPSEVLAPRYLFWSTLFWAGLFLIGLRHSVRNRWARGAAYCVALALPVLLLPQHFKDGIDRVEAKEHAEVAALSLVNGVRDDAAVKVLYPITEQVYRVADELRARRLDMFADGLQDWLGVSETNLFKGRQSNETLKGHCRVAAILKCETGAPAARLVGFFRQPAGQLPQNLVVIDATGVVRGIVRSAATPSKSRLLNRLFYLKSSTSKRLFGYIRDYNPRIAYSLHAADNGALSEESIRVQPPHASNGKP